MYKLTIRESKLKDIKEFADFIGNFFVINHMWKIHVKRSDMPLPKYAKEAVITGHELSDIIKENIEFNDASFSALEGNQILFRLEFRNGWTVYTTRKHWVEFFEEKFRVDKTEEMDSDLPEFNEFMQD